MTIPDIELMIQLTTKLMSYELPYSVKRPVQGPLPFSSLRLIFWMMVMTVELKVRMIWLIGVPQALQILMALPPLLCLSYHSHLHLPLFPLFILPRPGMLLTASTLTTLGCLAIGRSLF